MLDTSIYSNMNFNSVQGTLVKSSPTSKFIRFNMNSIYANNFFNADKPCKDDIEYIEVLQVMLCGGDNFLVEYVDIKEQK